MSAGPGVLPAKRRIAIIAVAAVAIAASLAGLRNGFVQDDVVLIVDNARLHDLGGWREILTSPYWPPPWTQDLYRPVTSLLLATQFVLGGGSPLVFRVISSLLYATAAVAVLGLAARLSPRRVAIGAALLFAAHPAHVEAVALGVGQSELVVGLLAVVMTLCYLDRRRQADGGLGAGDWAVLGALYLAGCLVKENALVLPGLLLGAELLLVPDRGRPRAPRLGPGFGFLAALGGLVLLARMTVLSGRLAGTSIAEGLDGLNAGGRALTMLAVIPRWARLLLWPAHLQADYSPQEIVAATRFGSVQAVGLGMALGVVAVAWLARRRMPVVSFGLAWCAVALLPVSNVLVPTGIVLAERTLFLPSIGLVLAAGGLAGGLWQGGGAARVRWRRAATIGCALLVAMGVVRGARRYAVWHDEASFSIRSAEDAPRSYRTQKAYAYTLFEQGRREEAIETYHHAIALAPPGHIWRVRNDLARRYFEAGDARRAEEQLRASLSDSPGQEETWNYLVLALLAEGAYVEAAREADSALARGLSAELFGGLRALADSAIEARAPSGSIRIRVRPPPRER